MARWLTAYSFKKNFKNYEKLVVKVVRIVWLVWIVTLVRNFYKYSKLSKNPAENIDKESEKTNIFQKLKKNFDIF